VLAVIGCMLLSLGGSPASAAANPNLNGCWVLSESTALSITSGASTTITGIEVDTNPDIVPPTSDPCLDPEEPIGSLSGSISGGSGFIRSSTNQGWVVTGVSGRTMSGFGYGDPAQASPPSSYGECEQEQQDNPFVGWYCDEFTATNVAPPSCSLGADASTASATIADASRDYIFAGHTDTDGVILTYHDEGCKSTMKVKWTGDLECSNKTERHTPIKDTVFRASDRGVTLTSDHGRVDFRVPFDYYGPATTGDFTATLYLARGKGTVSAHYSDESCSGGFKHLDVKHYER
jgi:hypothetical protein